MPSLIPLPVSRPSPTKASFFPEEEQFPFRWNSPPRKQLFRQVPVEHTIPAPEPLITPKPRPETTTEWKKALAEVKRDYVNRKYRQCYGRCNEILDNVIDLHKVETSYIIYLRFYAASAIEMQVRSLQHTSPYRTKLLLQAREHYRIASDLATEEDAAMRRPSFRALSPVPSLHSRAGSDMSYSTASTRMSSPAPSLSSLDSCMKSRNSTAPKRKKRVAFCDVPVYEPVIRPDSPTLGFDDWFTVSRQPTPEPVIAPEPPSLRNTEKPLPALPMPTPSIITTTSASPILTPMRESEDHDPFLHARSIHHYCTILNSLQRQIASHMSWLDRDIATALEPRPPQMLTEEMRALEVRSRIERLRASGWKRQRFDAKRYEALRESALADMD